MPRIRASRIVTAAAAATVLAATLAAAPVVAAPAVAVPQYPLIDYKGGSYTLAAWQTLRIHGSVQGLAPGTPLYLYRAELGDTDAVGTRLAIRTVVNHDRTFNVRIRLGVPGAYFYQFLPSPRQPVNQRGLVIDVR